MARIFVIFLVLVGVIGIYAWLSGGALERIRAEAEGYSNPLYTPFARQLGVPVSYGPGNVGPKLPEVPGARISPATPSTKDIEAARRFGDPSPLRGTVSIQTSYASAVDGGGDAAHEYIEVIASGDNEDAITLTGWSLQSAVSGQRAYIGTGVKTFRLGSGGTLEQIALAPGARAIISSGASPLGVSFRTNACTGYLAQFQSFTPRLANRCIDPRNEMPNTLENLQVYGASCIDFVHSLPPCTYYLGQFPENISPACRDFVKGALSYNSCTARHEFDAGFSGSSWRVYLGQQQELWNDAHDVIRLLDEKGQTVDVWSY